MEPIDEFRDLTGRLETLRGEMAELQTRRHAILAALLDSGWSRRRVARETGVSLNRVAQLARRVP